MILEKTIWRFFDKGRRDMSTYQRSMDQRASPDDILGTVPMHGKKSEV